MSKRLLFTLVLVACSHNPPARETSPAPRARMTVEQSPELRHKYEAVGRRYMISTQGESATRAAKKMFDEGGNIVDAAVAASFVISVERPHSTGIGGGGFMLLHWAASGETKAVDFRERAPGKATERMFLDAAGNVVPNLSTEGILAAAVPGLVAGLLEIHLRHGVLPLGAVLQPAIELAEKGFEVYPSLASALRGERETLAKFPASKTVFLKADGEPYAAGERLVQADLGRTLREIAKHGRAGFYKGRIADAIENEMIARKGLITRADLSDYKVKWREPVHGTFHGFDLYSMPPPSSGGIHVIQILNMLETLPLASMGAQSLDAVHFEASAMQSAFADRATYLGDADFVKVSVEGLLSKKYARELLRAIPGNTARPSMSVRAGNPPAEESTETTHFTIMDIEGNVVSSTQTINGHFGSGVVVPGTGILLNNEMDDFSAKPGAQNLFGAVGGLPNSIQPGKRPLSSMSPTIVFKDARAVLALGAPGGTRILTCVASTALNYLEFRMPLYDAVDAVGFHHQWQPDELQIEEPGLSPEVTRGLEARGWRVKSVKPPCRVEAIAREGDLLIGVSDPRDFGMALGE